MSVISISEGDRLASEIVVESGVLASSGLASLLAPPAGMPGRMAVFAQPGSRHVAAPIAYRLGAPLRLLPDGDAAKNLAVVEGSYLWLNELGFTRDDLVVAIGGGALTDVAGFIAGTYLRGVPAALIPTTLLGAVDAAVGGKTGVNVGGKNLAGVFRHPHRVIVDPDVLAALPRALLQDGAAEAVKAGWIGDPDLVEIYEEHGLAAPVGEVARRAIAVKARIVSQDFREAGVRAWLNYGHTVGHAVEVAQRMSHGHAVAVGMVAAAAVSAHRFNFPGADRQRRILERLGLPTAADGADPGAVRRLMALDKKRDARGLRMTLLRAVADPEVVSIDEEDVRIALAAIGVE